jgi:molybdate transport system regulatory protein
MARNPRTGPAAGSRIVEFRMPSLSLRVNFDPDGRIGPGKIELLEKIAAHGSISEGARQMNMSYKHAWDLVEEMNRLFGKPVVAAQTGGKHGGGAQLTPIGLAVVSRFRAIERAATAAAAQHMAALQAEIEAA